MADQMFALYGNGNGPRVPIQGKSPRLKIQGDMRSAKVTCLIEGPDDSIRVEFVDPGEHDLPSGHFASVSCLGAKGGLICFIVT